MAKKAKPMDRLTILSIAAQKEGLSYGKYMAKYNYAPPCLNNLPEEIMPPVKKSAIPEYRKEDYIAPLEMRECKFCGDTFQPEKRNQLYCGRNCSYEAAKKRDREKHTMGKVQRYCVICGGPLPLSCHANRLTCSKACSEKRKIIYNRARGKQYRENRKQTPEKGA